MKQKLLTLAALAAALTFTSCNHEDEVKDYDAEYLEIAENFVDKVVAPVYTDLASYAGQLSDALSELKANPSQDRLDKACKLFLNAREQWELSEAFLFGAATDFGIDPHIDSWPLDETAFNKLMKSPEILAGLDDDEDGAAYAADNLGNALLGFHGIEYILFKGGSPKSIADISTDQLIYAAAVSGDLRNRTWQLEVGWLGDKAPKAHRDALEELELPYTVSGSDNSYAENIKTAGQAGSIYTSLKRAVQAIIDGCSTIADEVGTSKIGKPYSGEDVTYIESPYSYNSIIDFYGNITSIYNVYYSGLHAFMNKYLPEVDANVVSAIDNALKEIGTGKTDSGKGMKYPFVNNIKDASVKEAISACAALVDQLEAANTAIGQLQ